MTAKELIESLQELNPDRSIDVNIPGVGTHDVFISDCGFAVLEVQAPALEE